MPSQIVTHFLNIEHHPRRQYVYLSMIVLIVAVLRFYKLGAWNFWEDEVPTLNRVLGLREINLLNQPLSMVVSHLALETLGISEWSARLVLAVVGILSVAIHYFLIGRMFGAYVALCTMLLLAFSP